MTQGTAKHLNATARAYAAVRAHILAGDHLPGERLAEEHLAHDIGVSRTPVREALRKLAAEGLVRFVPNQGAFVASVDDRGLRDIFSLRLLLEPHAAELAATRLGPADLRRLRDLARCMDDLEARRPPRHIQRIAAENTEFHRCITEASDNARLIGILGNLIEQVIVISTFSRYAPADLRRSLGHHAELVDALERRDGLWAASVMRSHLSAGLHACSAASGAAFSAIAA